MSEEKISIIKLQNGEEVIAFTKRDGYSYKLRKPHMMVRSQDGFGLMPWCLLTQDETVNVHERNVVFVADALDSMASEYMRIALGIELPSPTIDTDMSEGKILLTE